MKNQRTNELVKALKKKANADEKNIYSAIAEKLSKGRRRDKSINLWKLNLLAVKNRGKILVVCGKVLAKGSMAEKAEIYAFNASEKTKQEMAKAGIKFHLLEELLSLKGKEKDMVLIE